MPPSINPLVSVIIPCYNQGKYLYQAIESVQEQNYKPIEIIVVNDGSTDNTKDVVAAYPQVKYVTQEHLGLSSARNIGINNSTGELLVFLDADDLLYPYTIGYNVNFLGKNLGSAFVSGAHYVTSLDKKILGVQKEIVIDNHYRCFLKNNYIGMHATVMYRRYVFDEFLFDPDLKACEDYDMYLKVAHKFSVVHHNKILAMYRMHGANMSNNIPLMLSAVLEVLGRQKLVLVCDEERKLHKEGLKFYKNYYSNILYNQIRTNRIKPGKEVREILIKNNIQLYLRYIFIDRLLKGIRHSFLKKLIPENGKRFLFRLGLYRNYLPAVGSIKAGDLYRTTPFSKSFGYDRGGPIDRYYIENFLQSESDSIRGRVLEIGDNQYTLRFGKGNVQESDILHVDDGNANATIIGDLSAAPHIPDNSFDCIILTQTLHLVYDYKAVIDTCYRILKTGGTILLTVPGITPIDYGEWGKTWLWSFTGQVMNRILAERFPSDHTEINTYGNVYAASSFLYGMGLPEVKKKMLDFNDPNIQVIITAKAVKNGFI